MSDVLTPGQLHNIRNEDEVVDGLTRDASIQPEPQVSHNRFLDQLSGQRLPNAEDDPPNILD